MGDLAALRRFYARLVTATVGVTSPAIIDAFAAVPREQFLGSGPWQIPVLGGYMSSETADPAILYQDLLIGLAPEQGLNNGQPTLHALCLSEAAPRPGERVVHIGAGTGYYTAILAQVVGGAGTVTAFEIDPTLASKAADNLRGYSTVSVVSASAIDTPLPPSDVVYVSAGVSRLPTGWLDALAVGGRLVVPLTPTGALGNMWLITRLDAARYSARAFSPAAFIPCIGGQDPQRSLALAATLERGSPVDVRSLRRGGNPDDTAWLVDDGWWLSRAEA